MLEGYPGADFEKPREACAVFGVFATDREVQVAGVTFNGLFELQHRGEDGAGIVVNGDDRIIGIKDVGLVTSVFPDDARMMDAQTPNATIGIGHTLYSTQGSSVGPFKGSENNFALAHNGNISNITAVASEYEIQEADYSSDSDYVTQILDTLTTKFGNLHDAMKELLPKLEGAYCFVLTDGTSLFAARDPNGFRPLSLGKRPEDGTFMVASERPALEFNNGAFIREINPGEILTINESGMHSELIDKEINPKFCSFEFAYFARPDSTLEGRNVHLAREELGKQLAIEAPANADTVIGIPSSGIAAAMGYAKQSGIPYELGFYKNEYATRTFIQGSEESRAAAVKRKLRPNIGLIEGQRLVVVDDSIVRGNTMRKGVIPMLRKAGAAEIHLRIPTMPYKWPCFYGMATGDIDTLLANQGGIEYMRDYLGVDSLAFIGKEGFEKSIGLAVGSLCMACMDGDYPTLIPLKVMATRRTET